jgi:hypothetical protein
MITLYVDLFIFTNDLRTILPKIKEWLLSKLQMTYSPKLNYGLGIESNIDQNIATMHLNQ